MQKRLSPFRQLLPSQQLFDGLLKGNERLQTALQVSGWGFSALIAFLFAFSAFQYRLPDYDRANFAQMPLPLAGDVETTANIGGGVRSGVPRQRFDVFDTTAPASGVLSNQMDAELQTLRHEIIALRRSSESMRRLNEQLSTRLNRLEQDTPAKPTTPSAGVTRQTRPTAQKSASETPFTMKDASSAPRSDFGIDLGSYYTLDDVEAAWKALQATEGAIIGSLSPRASIYQNNGKFSAHLLAGPFPNAADAAATCARLTSRQISCKPTLYVGQQLSMR